MTFIIHEHTIWIDDEDWPTVGQHRWYIGGKGQKYVMTNDGLYLHRLVTKAPKGVMVVHINRNTFDNRKTNLRFVGHFESVLNRGVNKNNKSGVKGVCWDSRRGLWRASITVNWKHIHLGHFADLLDAKHARQKAEQAYWPGLVLGPNELQEAA